jgi:hypothetical protein
VNSCSKTLFYSAYASYCFLRPCRENLSRFGCRILLQSLALIADHPRNDRVVSSQAATPNSSAIKAACAIMSLPSIFPTCPILIIAIASLWSARGAVIRLVGATLPLPEIPLAFYSTHTKITPKQGKWHKLMGYRGEHGAACGWRPRGVCHRDQSAVGCR